MFRHLSEKFNWRPDLKVLNALAKGQHLIGHETEVFNIFKECFSAVSTASRPCVSFHLRYCGSIKEMLMNTLRNFQKTFHLGDYFVIWFGMPLHIQRKTSWRIYSTDTQTDWTLTTKDAALLSKDPVFFSVCLWLYPAVNNVIKNVVLVQGSCWCHTLLYAAKSIFTAAAANRFFYHWK